MVADASDPAATPEAPARPDGVRPLRLLRIAAVLGPLLLLMVVAAILWQQERARAVDEVNRSLEILRQHVARLVESQELLLAYVDDLVGDLSWDEIATSARFHDRLAELSRHSQLTRSIALIDARGVLRATSTLFPATATDLSTREYFRVLRDAPVPMAIGERITSMLRGEDLFTFARRRTTSGGFDGIVATGISAQEFQSFFETLRTDGRTAISLIRADGVVLARSPASQPQTLGPGTALRRSLAVTDSGIYETRSPIDGRRRLVGYSQVGRLPIVVSYAVAKAALYEQWGRRAALAAVGALMLAGLGYALASLALRRAARGERFQQALREQVETRTAELRSSEQRSTLLAREVDHRAKNMLAVVQAIVHMTRSDSADGLRQGINGRVTALARAHSLLSESRWHGADLRRLVEEELAPYRKVEFARVRSSGPPLALAPTAAQSLSLALHELATNAVKHGALAHRDGRLEIDWRVSPTGDLLLRWTESGAEGVTPPSRRGLGLSVVQRAIRDQLHGRVEFDWRREGLSCEIHVPAAQLARTPEPELAEAVAPGATAGDERGA